MSGLRPVQALTKSGPARASRAVIRCRQATVAARPSRLAACHVPRSIDRAETRSLDPELAIVQQEQQWRHRL